MQLAAAVKTPTKTTHKILTVDSKNSPIEQFAKWLYSETMTKRKNGFIPNGRIVTKGQCVSAWNSVSNSTGSLKGHQIAAKISLARDHFEKNFNCTIWPVYGVGWRASTKVETARWGIKTNCKAVAWAHRARRINAIIEERYIDQAVLAEFRGVKGKISQLSDARQDFYKAYMTAKKSHDEKLKDMTEKQKLLPETTL